MPPIYHPLNSPLTQSDVKQLLNLEELFHKKFLNEELLSEMIGFYVRLVENTRICNTQKEGQQHEIIRLYFRERISFILKRQEIIALLEKQKQEDDKRQKEKQKCDSNIEVSTELKEKERQMKIQIQLGLMKELESNMEQINKDISQSKQKKEKAEKAINNIYQKQDQALSDRLANRKKKLRKKSVDHKEIIIIEPAVVEIKKQELKAIQKQLTQNVQRFTIRMTRLTQLKDQQKREGSLARKNFNKDQKQYGRVKVKIMEVHEEQDEDFLEANKTTFAKKPVEKIHKNEQKIIQKKQNEEKKEEGEKQKYRNFVKEKQIFKEEEKPKDKGRVTKKLTHQNMFDDEEDLLGDIVEKAKEKQKQKKEEEEKEKEKQKERQTNSIKFQSFDNKRVTVRQPQQYEEIEDDEAF